MHTYTYMVITCGILTVNTTPSTWVSGTLALVPQSCCSQMSLNVKTVIFTYEEIKTLGLPTCKYSNMKWEEWMTLLALSTAFLLHSGHDPKPRAEPLNRSMELHVLVSPRPRQVCPVLYGTVFTQTQSEPLRSRGPCVHRAIHLVRWGIVSMTKTTALGYEMLR